MDRFVIDGIRAARRFVVGVTGMTVLLVGLALLVLPGPAFVVIPIGLGILAIEFEWARRWLRHARSLYADTPPTADSVEPIRSAAEDNPLQTAKMPPANSDPPP